MDGQTYVLFSIVNYTKLAIAYYNGRESLSKDMVNNSGLSEADQLVNQFCQYIITARMKLLRNTYYICY